MLEWLKDDPWCGEYVIGGDYSQEPDEIWIKALADGLRLKFIAPDGPTRWDGNRTIDFFLVSECASINKAYLRDEYFSDHRVVSVDCCIQHVGHVDVRFPKLKPRNKPAWMEDSC